MSSGGSTDPPCPSDPEPLDPESLDPPSSEPEPLDPEPLDPEPVDPEPLDSDSDPDPDLLEPVPLWSSDPEPPESLPECSLPGPLLEPRRPEVPSSDPRAPPPLPSPERTPAGEAGPVPGELSAIVWLPLAWADFVLVGVASAFDGDFSS